MIVTFLESVEQGLIRNNTGSEYQLHTMTRHFQLLTLVFLRFLFFRVTNFSWKKNYK